MLLPKFKQCANHNNTFHTNHIKIQPERMELKKTHDTDVPFFKKPAA